MSNPSVLLACDTTQGACSVALLKDGEIFSDLQEMTRGHAEALMPMIEKICADTGTPMHSLQRLAVTHGPGTFTGVRVGLSAMRGLALALQAPLCAIGTLHAMAAAAPICDTPLLVAVDARRDTYYTQAFDGQNNPQSEPQACSLAQVLAWFETGAVRVAGSGAAAIMQSGDPRFSAINIAPYPHAIQVLHLAAAQSDAVWAQGDPHHEPVYLRPPDATLPNPDKQLRRLEDSV
ncbi:tRNA (adenosine(37)-N6)-threonylcarbamoyltransferase complex dimerization subunit type 1 TsaB [Alphaproteobacteria bacterium]|nr:tRNA (adenosine(37)-N6)-threonylcarbamoyltransferase complex dimerization subunit type 1 TsaB [Alphaproteobacteria bacterium]